MCRGPPSRVTRPSCGRVCPHAGRVYRHGRKFTPPELVKQATGDALSIGPYMSYLNTKYGALYGL